MYPGYTTITKGLALASCHAAVSHLGCTHGFVGTHHFMIGSPRVVALTPTIHHSIPSSLTPPSRIFVASHLYTYLFAGFAGISVLGPYGVTSRDGVNILPVPGRPCLRSPVRPKCVKAERVGGG